MENNKVELSKQKYIDDIPGHSYMEDQDIYNMAIFNAGIKWGIDNPAPLPPSIEEKAEKHAGERYSQHGNSLPMLQAKMNISKLDFIAGYTTHQTEQSDIVKVLEDRYKKLKYLYNNSNDSIYYHRLSEIYDILIQIHYTK